MTAPVGPTRVQGFEVFSDRVNRTSPASAAAQAYAPGRHPSVGPSFVAMSVRICT